MDITTLLGLAFGAICLIISILIGGELITFYDAASIFITIGGGIASTFISYKLSDFAKIFKIVGKAFSSKQTSSEETIHLLVGLSQRARRDGLLSLETEQEGIEDDYIRQSLQLIIDGVEPDTIREAMDLELNNLEARHAKGQGLFRTMASLFPAWGMIGTLIGLINLLKNLDDPSMIGPSMAVALITTFYGCILANYVCTPIANKLSLRSKEEVHQREMIIEGILSIQAGENPRIMEHKLKTFLSPEEKKRYDELYGESGQRIREEAMAG